MSFTGSLTGRAVPLRRAATVLACAAALAMTASSPAHAAPAQAPDGPAKPEAEEALFGAGDPGADGVWRQSLALLAQDAAGYTPADEAVGWLLDQQCEDGSFLAFRVRPNTPCSDVTAANSNATALAVQALAALGGHGGAVDAGLRWLRNVQNEDGGWSYSPGDASDANSTAVVIGAFTAAGQDPSEVRRQGNSAYDGLTGLQLGCEADAEQRGAFAWQPDPESGELYPNPAATVDAVLAAHGSGLLVDPEQAVAASPPSCDPPGDDASAPASQDGDDTGNATGDTAGDTTAGSDAGGTTDAAADGATAAAEAGAAGAAWLADTLAGNDEHLLIATPDGHEQPDYGTTAKAVLALVAAGEAEAAQGPLGWLQDNHAAWEGHAESPAALATLVLAAQAGGASPEDFGGTDLVAALNRLGPAPDGQAADSPTTQDAAEDGEGAGALPWVVALALAVVLGAGAMVLLRRRRGSAPAGADEEEAA